MSTSRRCLTALAFTAALAMVAAVPAEAARPAGRRAATYERASAGEKAGLGSWLSRLWVQVVALFDEESGGNVPHPTQP